jgi:serine protease Do
MFRLNKTSFIFIFLSCNILFTSDVYSQKVGEKNFFECFNNPSSCRFDLPPTDPVIKNKKTPSKKSPPPSSGSTGSGFFVSKLGHIVTNEHIVRRCGSVTVGDNANKQVSASVLETDKRNDLALLRISSTQMASAETLSLISKLGAQKLGLKLVPLASGGLMRSDDIELGESVMVAGYPYGELYSNTIKVTGGMVSAVKGMGDDSAQFQMDAAVQPGNSGGPIYDENGNIVGVVISQLNKLKVAKAIGSLPENVNFGIKASTVRQFLTSAGLPTKWSNRTEKKSTKELAQIAKNQTVMVVCNP